jgi:hypothetical protein
MTFTWKEFRELRDRRDKALDYYRIDAKYWLRGATGAEHKNAARIEAENAVAAFNKWKKMELDFSPEL